MCCIFLKKKKFLVFGREEKYLFVLNVLVKFRFVRSLIEFWKFFVFVYYVNEFLKKCGCIRNLEIINSGFIVLSYGVFCSSEGDV